MLDAPLRTPISREIGPIVDLAVIGEGARSLWLLLTQDGSLVRFDADSGQSTPVARVRATVEEAPSLCREPAEAAAPCLASRGVMEQNRRSILSRFG